MQHPDLKAGDIFLTRSSSLLGRLIRFFERSLGESPTIFNHVGIILNDSRFDLSISMEALWKVRTGRFYSFYHGDKSEVAIYRHIALTDRERYAIADAALPFKGKKYGWWKLFLHGFKYIFGDKFPLSKIIFIKGRPICSYLVAHAYDATSYWFGVHPDEAQPDDIGDFITSQPESWKEVLKLQRI